jgi:hypothetical protein
MLLGVEAGDNVGNELVSAGAGVSPGFTSTVGNAGFGVAADDFGAAKVAAIFGVSEDGI